MSDLKEQTIVGLSLHKRTFLYRTTCYHDLWSLLVEILFNKLANSPDFGSCDISLDKVYNVGAAWKCIFKGKAGCSCE